MPMQHQSLREKRRKPPFARPRKMLYLFESLLVPAYLRCEVKSLDNEATPRQAMLLEVGAVKSR